MKHTKEMYVFWREQYGMNDGFGVFPFDMSSCGYVLVGKQQIEFEVPDDFNPVPIQVSMLEKEKEKAMEEYNERVFRINEQISKLQALTYSDENVVDAEVPHGQ